MIAHWVVLLTSAFNKTQPFLEPSYSSALICLYSISMAAAWVVKNTDEWQNKLAAVQSHEKLLKFQCCETVIMVPMSMISVFLLFESTIPIEMFYVCLIIAVFGRRIVDWMWEKQLRLLSLA